MKTTELVLFTLIVLHVGIQPVTAETQWLDEKDASPLKIESVKYDSVGVSVSKQMKFGAVRKRCLELSKNGWPFVNVKNSKQIKFRIKFVLADGYIADPWMKYINTKGWKNNRITVRETDPQKGVRQHTYIHVPVTLVEGGGKPILLEGREYTMPEVMARLLKEKSRHKGKLVLRIGVHDDYPMASLFKLIKDLERLSEGKFYFWRVE